MEPCIRRLDRIISVQDRAMAWLVELQGAAEQVVIAGEQCGRAWRETVK